MANMRIAKKSSRPIWRRGTMAFMMDFRTICKPERGEKGHSSEQQCKSLSIHPNSGRRKTGSREDAQVNRVMQEARTAWRIPLGRGSWRKAPLQGRERQAAEQSSSRGCFPVSCLSSPHLDLVGHGLCSSVPPVSSKARIQPCQCPGQEGQEDWCQQQPSFFIYPRDNRRNLTTKRKKKRSLP